MPEDDRFLDIKQVESIIFLQDFPHSQTLDVSYSKYVDQWVDMSSHYGQVLAWQSR